MFRRSVKLGLNFLQNKLCREYVEIKQSVNVVKRSLSSVPNLNLDVIHEEIQSAANIFPKFAKDLSDNPICEHFPEMKMRFLRMIDYASKVGKKQIPSTTLMCYKILETPDKLIEENINLAYLLGWFGEMLQTIMFMAGDIIDVVDSRNNTTTWHSHRDVGLQVANDTCVLQNSIFLLLRKYFKTHKNYVEFLELIQAILFETFQGHNLELIRKDIESFNMDLVARIAKYKITPNTYTFPLMSALYLTGLHGSVDLEAMKHILNDVAVYKKVEMDFLDSFAEHPKHLNIKHGYCSWLAVKSLEKADDTKRIVLKDNYGRLEEISVGKIYSLYNELNLPCEFEQYKIKKGAKIQHKIEELNDKLLKDCLEKIFEETSN